MRRSETRILKSKSGQSLAGNVNPHCSNGFTSSARDMHSKHNGKQQYNEQVKRSMISASSSRKGSNSNSNSESFDEASDIM